MVSLFSLRITEPARILQHKVISAMTLFLMPGFYAKIKYSSYV
jgi:hypothetical protein